MTRALVAEWKRNRSIALRAAGPASGLSREDFAEWATEQPRAIPLYLKVLWAAGMNGHDQTLRAMGAVLGRAARASADQDEDEFGLVLREPGMHGLTSHAPMRGDLSHGPAFSDELKNRRLIALRFTESGAEVGARRHDVS